MPSPAIDATGLTKRYGDETAVDGLDLSIPQGTVYGFLGPNGAGKTTTMRMLTTLTKPTHGTASVAGASIDDRDAVVKRIGYLPEEPPLFDELTGREQLEYIAGLRDLPAADATERIDSLLERFGLADDADKRISAYSKGMKQKAGIVQALLHDPDVVFLDEPTSGLDPRAARTVRDTIADLAEDETTVFLSSHILSVVDELADTVGVLFKGGLVAEGGPDALKKRAETGEQQSLEDVFLEVTTEVDGT
ncbi:ABC transporter ATP-binding protein [Salarchaeum sp. JOR-1]|uniref:ABC transporter ATP-binding protein n=1 Tax=Salarchaeum sp. JOR-1 TaxID=2599399 RepID=UPI0011988E4A|nr:ABC transporter ATP-binding protein [Salarchaeum sp. JOR-1]QDX41209.1 ABC transporter ATP-binding protein [Salarchaeum sp. JOR-1]